MGDLDEWDDLDEWNDLDELVAAPGPSGPDWEGALTLVRHGQTKYNAEGRFLGRTDVPLDATGERQALALAGKLGSWAKKSGVEFGVLLSSPLRRALSTARVIGRELGLEPREEPLLVERDYGVFEGLTRDEAAARHPELSSEYSGRKAFVNLPGGESAMEVEARVRELLFEKLPRVHGGTSEVLLVTHLNPVRAAFRLLGLAGWEVYSRTFGNLSVSRIRVENR
ncbi:MAG: histidine phosphatase family protein [Promethearchaeota archaeon]